MTYSQRKKHKDGYFTVTYGDDGTYLGRRKWHGSNAKNEEIIVDNYIKREQKKKEKEVKKPQIEHERRREPNGIDTASRNVRGSRNDNTYNISKVVCTDRLGQEHEYFISYQRVYGHADVGEPSTFQQQLYNLLATKKYMLTDNFRVESTKYDIPYEPYRSLEAEGLYDSD